MKYKAIPILSVSLFFLLSCKNTQEKKLAPNNKPSLSLEKIKQISKETYIALFPLVYNYGTMYSQAINNRAPEYIGGLGSISIMVYLLQKIGIYPHQIITPLTHGHG